MSSTQPFEFDIPQSIQLLSSISDYVSPYRLPESDWQQRPIDPSLNSKVIPELLDALIFFLRTGPKDGKLIAMTLSISSHDMIVTLAVNATAHVTCPDAPSPQSILETIWNYMARMAATARARDEEAVAVGLYTKFAGYLLDRYSVMLRHRYEKWRNEYGRFRMAYDQLDTTTSLLFSARIKEYLEKIHVTLKPEITQERSTAVFLKKVNIQDGKFDVIRYAKKLLSPVLNIMSIISISRSPKFKDYFKLTFRIHVVANPTPTHIINKQTLPEGWYDEATVVAFLRKAYTTYGSQLAENAITALARDVAQNPRMGDISQTHPECLLIQHHHNNPHIVTHPHIALLKPSCFQCSIFLDAYNASVQFSDHTSFSIKARCNHVYPSLLPAFAEADTSLIDHMRNSIHHVIRSILVDDKHSLRHLLEGYCY